MELSNCAVVWDALSAIATVAAVIVSLYLANRKEKPKSELEVTNTITYLYDKGFIVLSITLNNIGNRPIIIMDCGKVKGNFLDVSYNKYLTNFTTPEIIEVGNALLLTYEYDYEGSYSDNDIKDDKVNIFFTEQNFGVRDSKNNIYKP